MSWGVKTFILQLMEGKGENDLFFFRNCLDCVLTMIWENVKIKKEEEDKEKKHPIEFKPCHVISIMAFILFHGHMVSVPFNW